MIRRAQQDAMAIPLGAALLIVVVLSSVIGGQATGLLPASPSTQTPSVSSQGVALSPEFWGVGISSRDTTGTLTQYLPQTPFTYLLYPAGNDGEQTNLTSGTYYDFTGASTPVGTTVSNFISECEQVSCHAVLELPLEINSSATAAYEVRYVEGLSFRPAYWELGNEPAKSNYECFGLPWTQWGSACQGLTGPSAGAFAAEVAAYIRAVRSVDPTAQFICMGGSGVRSLSETYAWVYAVESVNGPNCAAVGVHDRPASSNTVNPTLTDFFSYLQDPSVNLPSAVANTRAAIAAACASCTTQIFVSEFAAAGQCCSYYALYSGGFDDVLFEAAQYAQLLSLHVANTDYFAWATGGKATLTNGAGGPTLLYDLWANVLSELGTTVYNSSLLGQNGVYTAATSNATGDQLLFVNTQPSTSETLALAPSGFALSSHARLLVWTGGNPSTSSVDDINSTVTLPPLSVGVISTSTPPSGGNGATGVVGTLINPRSLTETLAILSVVLIGTATAGAVLLPGYAKLASAPLFALAIYFLISIPQTSVPVVSAFVPIGW